MCFIASLEYSLLHLLGKVLFYYNIIFNNAITMHLFLKISSKFNFGKYLFWTSSIMG